MHEVGSLQRKLLIAALLAASSIPLWAGFKNVTSLTDDACITLCYAKNIARGDGFVFNCPPASLGTTTPLFALTVAAILRTMPGVDIAKIAVIFSALCWAGIIWIFFFSRRTWKLTDWETVVLGLTIAATGWIEFLGMEAYLFAFLLVISISLFLSARYFLCGLATGFLFLTRGEGILITCILLAWSLISLETRKSLRTLAAKSARLALGFALPAIAWFLYAQFAFGRFLPNTLHAKQAQLQSGLWKSFFERLVEDWIPSWGARFAPRAAPYLNAWWIAVLMGIFFACVERRRWLVWLAWAALYISGYSAIEVSAYRWYQLPILFVLNIYLALGLIALARLTKRLARSNRAGLVVSICLLSVCICSLGTKTVKMIRTYREPKGESYRALAEWFKENSSPGESIAYIEIGYLGLYTDNCIVDLAGLLDPEMIPHVSRGDFAWGFWKYAPRYFVYLEDFDWALGGIISDPGFRRLYTEVASLRGPRESDLVIFEKVGSK